MKLRTRLDRFSATLLSALAAAEGVACGGSAVFSAADPGGAGGGSSGNAGAGGAGAADAGTSGEDSGQSGASTGGARVAGSGQGGAPSAGAPGSAGAGPHPYPCTNPQDLGNGFVQCDGFKHRSSRETCTSRVPRPEEMPNPRMLGRCSFDADCTDKPYGWCNASGAQIGSNYCEYGCVTDSDCAGSQICECSELVGRCVAAGCDSDAACQAGYLCRAYDPSGGCGPNVYACQSSADICGIDADCQLMAPQGLAHDMCNFDAEANRFQCTFGGCAIGRPFLVGGRQRLARAVPRADWSELALLPRLDALDATLSAHLAEQWTRSALLEHASIAAFARFALQLLSLAAPASLVERATAAMVDETRHAQACFAIASGYAGAPLGPGRLAVEGSLDESSLPAIVLNAIREGCVGETVAAIEAREAAAHAADPALRELLLAISEDEMRHAELAYRFLKWALAAGGPELERAAQHEFAALAAQVPAAPSALTDWDEALLRHGIVPNAMRRAIREQAMAQVILPCSRALFRSEARNSSRSV
ncbi:MAG: ferritin-like domain-containing protein [Pseudomonadota bacterium]